MNQFGISEDMTREPNFLELTQNAPNEPTSEAGIFRENSVEQQIHSTHHVPAVNQEKALLLQLEFLHQTLQQQQTLVDSLTEQLLSSQEQIAQMERDFALLQQRYDEQRHLHKNAEDNCQNLRTRLCRQQRQTLQFKTALEKCLDSTLDQSELVFNQTYAKVDAQSLQQPLTHHRPVPNVDLISLKTLGLAEPTLAQAHDVTIEASTLGSDTTYSVETHQASITLNVQGDASSDEADCSQAIVFPMRSTYPSSFQGHPVQPWSAPQSLHAGNSRKQHQVQSIDSTDTRPNHAVSTSQAEATKTTMPTKGLGASTDSLRSHSSPLLEPLRPRSQRRPVARVELPPLPRCRR